MFIIYHRRICPGAHLAEAQMFNVIVRVLANCSIEPARDEDGDPISIDIDDIISNGNVVLPREYELRFVRHDHDADLEEEDDDDDDNDNDDGCCACGGDGGTGNRVLAANVFAV